MPVIGFLNRVLSDATSIVCGLFAQGLKETRLREGENLPIEYRWADGENCGAGTCRGFGPAAGSC